MDADPRVPETGADGDGVLVRFHRGGAITPRGGRSVKPRCWAAAWRLLRQDELSRVAILADMDRQRGIESGPLKQTAEQLRHKVRESPRPAHGVLPSADIAGRETVATKIVGREQLLWHVGQDIEPSWC
jgi:hypothetical protein